MAGTCAVRLRFLTSSSSAEDADFRRMETKEKHMLTRQLIGATCAALVLGVATANAGPCNTAGKDAGSGPTPGYTGKTITTGSADKREHPPTETMNRVAGGQGHFIAGCSKAAAGATHRCAAGPGRSTLGEDERRGVLMLQSRMTFAHWCTHPALPRASIMRAGSV